MREQDEKKPPNVTRASEPPKSDAATKDAPKEDAPKKDRVQEADEESFPASDPPSFNPGHAGGPKRPTH